MDPSTSGVTAQSDCSRAIKIRRSIWMILASLGIVLVLVFLISPQLLSSHQKVAPAVAPTTAVEPAAAVSGPQLIRLAPASPLREQLRFFKTVREKVHYPKMTVTGSVLARIRPGSGSTEDRWQFNTGELSSTFADWVRAKSEVEFAQSQYDKTKELVAAQTGYLETVVKRLQPLGQEAAVAVAQIKQAQSELLRAQIQGEKDLFTAQSTLRTAQKTKAALERDLSQLGLEQAVFAHAADNRVLVIANVPEGRISEVSVDQSCQVRFYGYPNEVFPGHVEALSSTVTADRRTLRVLFDVKDSENRLKPGMFGEVGLGTDEREAILVPPKSLLHLGRRDYVIVHDSADVWRVTEVKVGELHDDRFEILGGLPADREIIADGALLLKPLVGEALAQPEPATTP